MIDVINGLLIVVLFLFLIYFAWRSTEVREIAATPTSLVHRDAVVVPGRNSLLNRLVDRIQTSNLRSRRRRGVQTRSNNSVEEVEYSEGNILMTHVLSWSSNESISQGTNTETDAEVDRLRRHAENLIHRLVTEDGPEAIIRQMDQDLPDEVPSASTAAANSTTMTAAEEAQNCTNENNENVNKQQGGQQPDRDATDGGSERGAEEQQGQIQGAIDEDPWKIKIKYLNDDMKVVKAQPSQTLGDFKRQNFAVELAAKKLVRLVFNGKVLQPDGTSLRSCGLFENCVVHCLVHNLQNVVARADGGEQRPIFAEREASVGAGPSQFGAVAEINETTQRGLMGPEMAGQPSTENYSSTHLMRNRFQQWLLQQWLILYNWRFFTELLLFSFTITVLYLRVRYAELFTATATIGLILVSVIVLGISLALNIM